MVNSDFKRTYDDPFMKAFDKELKEIQKQVVNAERHKRKIECVPKNRPSEKSTCITMISDITKLKTFYKMNDLMEVEETEETD